MDVDVDVNEWNERFETQSATEILRWTFAHVDANKVAFSTSFGAEGMVLLHMMVSMGLKPRVFTVDTGRQFQETYDVWNEAVQRFGVEIEAYSPDAEDLRRLLEGHGPNLFYESVENRKRCCYVRKVAPLQRALAGADVWLAALRRSQGESRQAIPIIARNELYSLYKICPLANWLEENVWTYIRSNDVPYNKLYDEGFKTIGCRPCTRPVRMGEDVRSGRWWWEESEQKECGIHLENGQVARTKKVKDFQI